jgi:hypothetical protein
LRKFIFTLLAATILCIAATSCKKEVVEPQVQTEQPLEKDCCGENGTLPPGKG